jgi:hypothetical protein
MRSRKREDWRLFSRFRRVTVGGQTRFEVAADYSSPYALAVAPRERPARDAELSGDGCWAQTSFPDGSPRAVWVRLGP